MLFLWRRRGMKGWVGGIDRRKLSVYLGGKDGWGLGVRFFWGLVLGIRSFE